MDSGGNMQSNEERTAERLMDNYLKALGFHRKKIAKDGSCLFRAVAEQVLHCQSLHTEVRAKCVEFLKQNRGSYEAFIEGDFEEYLMKLQDPQQWVGEVEISALAIMYKRDFEIFQEPGKPAVNITDNNFKDKVRLCFLNGNHYDSVYPISHVKNAAVCQSILYELLYDGVFKVDQSSLSLCHRAGRPSDLLSDDAMAVCGSSDESDYDSKEPLWVENGSSSTPSRGNSHSFRGRGRGRQFSERVRRSLNPTLLRNVEYDIWHKTKRAQQKMDYSIAAGMQFSVGDRCQVRLEGSGRSYNATIKEVPENNGPVTVFIEDLGKKQVPLWNIRPYSAENTWSTVVREKKLSNGHGDWEDRGRGRGRGKPTPASYSAVSQTATTGSSGRVQKQNSWPPQATTEEQGGPKSRTSVSSLEAAFGVTAKERQAKVEEEMNMALMEIQLRDEHSFPALKTHTVVQAERGRKKGGEKRQSQRHKTSPVEEVSDLAPSSGDRPKSSTPPPPISSNPTLPTTDPTLPPASAAREAKSNTPSYTSAADLSSPPANIKPSVPSLFTLITPVLPAASSPPAPSMSSSPPRSDTPPSSSSVSEPIFIAPIAPSPTAAHCFLRSFSPPPPPSSPLPPPQIKESLPHQEKEPPPLSQIKEAPPIDEKQVPPTPTADVLLQTEGTLQTSQMEKPVSQAPVTPHLDPVSVSEEEKRAPPCLPETQSPTEVQSSAPQPQLETHTQSSHPPPGPSQVPSSPSVQSQAEAPPPPEKPQSPPPQQSQPPYPSSPPHSHHPLGAIPLQQLSQIYQDPLFPGFPQGDKGEMAPIPPMSTNKTGDDLPKDLNMLRFFFNLGVKAYSMPIVCPYLYLLPLQQIYTMQPHPPPLHPSPSPPTKPPEVHPPAQYPPPSVSPPYNHQTVVSEPPCPAEPPHPSEPPFNSPLYQGVTQPSPVPHRMPCPPMYWQQGPPPRNPSYPVEYPSPPPPYSGPPPSSQGYHQGQGLVHSLYPSSGPQYPPFSLGYQSSPTPEELQVNQRAMELLQPANGDSMPGHGHIRVLGHMEGPAAANVANANNNRAILVPPNYGYESKYSPSVLKEVLLVDPPLNNTPILTLVSHSDIKDVSVSKATMKAGSIPGSPSNFRGPRKQQHPSSKTYVPPGAPDPSQLGYPATAAMAEQLSVACSTEDDWEAEGFTMSYSGRKPYRGRGGRGRGGYDAGRGAQRRRHGEVGAGLNYVQFNSSHRGRGRERGY
nr:OTU domain-containing protein 4 isoform X2 [Nothobranchius furzeri]